MQVVDDANGMFHSRKGKYGKNIPNNSTSGEDTRHITRMGNLGMPAYEWTLSPQFQMGITNFNPASTLPGGNIQAVEAGSEAVAQKAGEPTESTTGQSVGGTATFY